MFAIVSFGSRLEQVERHYGTITAFLRRDNCDKAKSCCAVPYCDDVFAESCDYNNGL
jgi:hypothetical protein